MNAAEASAQIAWAICEDPAWLAAGDVAKLAGDFQRLQGHAYYQSGQNGEADGSTHFQAGVLAYNAEDWVTAEAEFIISEIAYKSGKTQFVEADGFYFNAELYYIQADVLYMNGAP